MRNRFYLPGLGAAVLLLCTVQSSALADNSNCDNITDSRAQQNCITISQAVAKNNQQSQQNIDNSLQNIKQSISQSQGQQQSKDGSTEESNSSNADSKTNAKKEPWYGQIGPLPKNENSDQNNDNSSNNLTTENSESAPDNNNASPNTGISY